MEKEDKLKKDEEQDVLLVKEVLEKEKNMIKIASILAQKFRQKYGAEFGGIVDIEYDVINSRFNLKCGKDYSIDIDENDIEDMPVRIKMFREQAAEDRKKPRPSLMAKKEDKNKQKLKTEEGEEIKVPVKETMNAEKELMEEEDNEE